MRAIRGDIAGQRGKTLSGCTVLSATDGAVESRAAGCVRWWPGSAATRSVSGLWSL